MTPTAREPPAKRPLAPDVAALDERSRRAWTEPMAVRPLADGRYLVEGDGTHVVDLRASGCTCRDSRRRGELCKHVRRVAIEITLGRVPSPERASRCRACGREVVPDPGADQPHLCGACSLEPGDVVFDRERGRSTPLRVVAVTDRPADEVTVPGTGLTVAEYGDNRAYSPSDPVVEVVYPAADGGDDRDRSGRPERRYSFPLSRLVKPGEPGKQATLARWAT